MLRRLFTLVSALSLAMWIAACVVWIRSRSGTEYLERLSQGRIESGIVTQEGCAVEWARCEIRLSRSHTVFGKRPIFRKSPNTLPDGDSEFDDPKDQIWVNPPIPKAEWIYGRWSGSLPLPCARKFFGVTLWGIGTPDGFRDRVTRGVAFPAWWLVVASFSLPLVWMASAARNRRRLRSGLCASCGYDLRATRDRCPECGAVPS